MSLFMKGVAKWTVAPVYRMAILVLFFRSQEDEGTVVDFTLISARKSQQCCTVGTGTVQLYSR